MPDGTCYRYFMRRPTCRIRPTWSTKRGGCRLDPNHAGPCKPGKGWTSASWPL